MSLEIFELSISIARLLNGEKEAIGDIVLLYQRHPEMFENLQDVMKTIDEVVKNPEIIIKNSRGENDGNVLVAKQLNNWKMGDVVIKNDNGTNIIFHANKKRIKEFKKLKKKMADGGDVLTPHTQAQSLDGRLVDNHISSTDENILPQTFQQNKPKFKKLIKIKPQEKGMTR